MSSTSYQLTGYCETQGKVQTAQQSLSMSTSSNGGTISVVKFMFESPLTAAQKIKLVCALALQFEIDYEKVSTWDGYFCSELLNRRLLQQTSPRLLHISSGEVPVYFGINTQLTADTSSTVVAAQANTSTLASKCNDIQILLILKSQVCRSCYLLQPAPQHTQDRFKFQDHSNMAQVPISSTYKAFNSLKMV